MNLSVSEGWVEAPLRRFVEDSRVRLALLLHPSGQVLGQHGFEAAVEVMTAAALASAIYSSAGRLGEAVEGRAFTELHHGGGDRQVYIAEGRGPAGAFVLLAVFGQETSLGLVRLYARDLCGALRDLAPATTAPREFDVNFERELRRSLSLLFGGHTPASSSAINPSS